MVRETTVADNPEDRAGETRSFSALFSGLMSDIGLLIQQEVALAKKEFQGALAQAVVGVVVLAVGGILATVGLIAVLTSIVLALALVMPDWAAALLVGVVFLVLGAIFAWIGINRMRKLKLIPERTAQTLKEDVAMIREKTQ